MNFLELFDSRDKKKRLSHIKNLVALACADGKLDDVEMKVIFNVGLRAGLTPSELERIFERPKSINFYPPDSFRERIEQLYDLTLVMMADGKIDQRETHFCKHIAMILGFEPTIIDKMVQDIIQTINDRIAFEIAMNKLLLEFE